MTFNEINEPNSMCFLMVIKQLCYFSDFSEKYLEDSQISQVIVLAFQNRD